MFSVHAPPRRRVSVSGKYIPPHKRDGATLPTMAPMQDFTTIETVLRAGGWTKGVGPNFYFPPNHPHIHITVLNSSARHIPETSIYSTVTMVAISDGQQDTGGGGTTFLSRHASFRQPEMARLTTAFNSISTQAQEKISHLNSALNFLPRN